MEKGEGKVNELENLKKKIKESLTKDEGYIELLEKKNRLINSLKQIEANRYEARTLLEKYDMIGKNSRLLRKILNLYEKIPYPADLKNLIKTSIAFSNIDNEYDYLRNLFNKVYTKEDKKDPKSLQKLGFSLREIEILTKISKSQLARELKEIIDEE